MPTRTGTARWEGTIGDGAGTVRVESGALEGSYSTASRFEDAAGTNPEELIGAAHAGCFSMFLSGILTRNDYVPTRIDTTAHVTIEKTDDGPTITSIHLETEAAVADIGGDEFEQFAEEAKQNCPVSKALSATPITLEARLAS
jgi:lipoyl-dependent peroxiredoxin